MKEKRLIVRPASSLPDFLNVLRLSLSNYYITECVKHNTTSGIMHVA